LNSRLQAVDDDLQVELALPAMSVWPVSSSERTRKSVLFGETLQSRTSLSWSAFVFGSTATRSPGSGKVIGLEARSAPLAAIVVAGGRRLEPDGCGDVARRGPRFFSFFRAPRGLVRVI